MSTPPTKNGAKKVRNSKGQFVAGCEGGSGRPQGSRNRATILARSLMGDALPEIVKRVIDKALAGDFAAQKLVLERIVPVPRDNVISADLGELRSLDDLPEVAGRIIKAVGDSVVTPSEALTLGRLLSNHVKILEVSDIDKRLKILEQNGIN